MPTFYIIRQLFFYQIIVEIGNGKTALFVCRFDSTSERMAKKLAFAVYRWIVKQDKAGSIVTHKLAEILLSFCDCQNMNMIWHQAYAQYLDIVFSGSYG